MIRQWLAEGKAYRCYCTRKSSRKCETPSSRARRSRATTGVAASAVSRATGVTPVVRFKNPQEGAVVVDDAVHGNVAFQNAELDDLIIERSDGNPTYNFCVVVDDYDMKITHVIRGDDHLNNTPRQMNMLRAMGVEPPVYAHLPMILGPDGTKLSKRHGAVSVLEYREEGYLPEALLNYLARLGWSHGDQEIFTLEEMTALFDIADVNKSASRDQPGQARLDQPAAPHADAAGETRAELRGSWSGSGVTVEEGAPLEAVIVAQRERSKTLKEMARGQPVLFRSAGMPTRRRRPASTCLPTRVRCCSRRGRRS